jgi:hypothetical protein
MIRRHLVEADTFEADPHIPYLDGALAFELLAKHLLILLRLAVNVPDYNHSSAPSGKRVFWPCASCSRW